MRNAGDFANAVDLEKDFQQEILLRATRCAPLRTPRANQQARWASIMRTTGAQISTHPVVTDVPRDGPISSVRKRWNSMRINGKVKETKVRFL